MKAQEARRITEQAMSEDGEAVKEVIDFVRLRIRIAAEDGKKSICRPFWGMARQPSVRVKEAVFNILRGDGYVVKHHQGYDQRDPSYDEISW